MQLTIATIAAGLAATASAEFSCKGNYFSFFNRPGAVSYQRLDPALFPGTDSPHLHSFDGGNGISASTGFAETQSSSCSTARVKDDKSLYWRPTLFFKDKDGSFSRVPEKSTKIYYKYGDGANWANVTEFPEDFSMVAGDPFKRSDGSNPAGVRWGCHTPDGNSNPIFSNGFPKGFGSCDYGFASEVTFPSCWNGQKIDPKNPNAHMAWPNSYAGVGIENCPTTHRAARFPTIFIEFWYDISSFKGKFSSSDVPWALSNGDPTGFGFHADFLNGWKKGVLGKATSKDNGCTCGCGCGQTEMEQCFGSANVYKDSDSDFKSCSVSGGKSEDTASSLKSLPGCNPLQYGPAQATVASGAGCSAVAAPSSGGDKTSAAASTPAVTSGAKASSAAASSAKAASSVKKDGTPALSLSVPNKQVDDSYGPTSAKASASATPAVSQQYGNGPTGGYEATKPTPSGPKDSLPVLSLASTPVPAGSTGKPSGSSPSGSPAGGKGEDCKAPVYVTVTPTIFVTAGVNSTSCGLGTVTKTTTQTATVTIEAYGGFEYGST